MERTMADMEIDKRQNEAAVVRLTVMTAAGLMLLSSMGLLVILWMSAVGATRNQSGVPAESSARL
jgi:hypothetical protein